MELIFRLNEFQCHLARNKSVDSCDRIALAWQSDYVKERALPIFVLACIYV